MPKPLRRVTDPNLIAMGHLIKHLMIGRMDNRELAAATGLHYLTVCRYTAALHQAGAAHITAYRHDKNGRQTIRVFKLGQDDDAQPVILSRPRRAMEQRRRERLQRPLPQAAA